MLIKFKLWLYNFIKLQLVEDELFIRVLYNKLEDEKRFREQLAKDIRQRADAKCILTEIKKYQDNCSHLKGGKYSSANLGPGHCDFCISDHRFPDGTRKVTCLICNKDFDPESPEAIYMLKNTTNTKSASEFHPEYHDRTQPVGCEPVTAVFQETIDVARESLNAGHNFSEEEPFAPWMSRKRWLKLDALYKKLTAKKKVGV
jgi:hypothetical protein